jgi:hypothetical protein
MGARSDIQEVAVARELLQQYSDSMGALMELLQTVPAGSRQDRAEASRLYTSLKSRLNEDRKRLEQKRSRTGLTHVESSSVLPALQKAIGELRPATNTNPITSGGHSAIYAARIEINFQLNQLNP